MVKCPVCKSDEELQHRTEIAENNDPGPARPVAADQEVSHKSFEMDYTIKIVTLLSCGHIFEGTSLENYNEADQQRKEVVLFRNSIRPRTLPSVIEQMFDEKIYELEQHAEKKRKHAVNTLMSPDEVPFDVE